MKICRFGHQYLLKLEGGQNPPSKCQPSPSLSLLLGLAIVYVYPHFPASIFTHSLYALFVHFSFRQVMQEKDVPGLQIDLYFLIYNLYFVSKYSIAFAEHYRQLAIQNILLLKQNYSSRRK